MKIIMLVASVLLGGCIGRAPGDYPGRTDGAPTPPATEEAFASRSGSRLRAYAGYRCSDGSQAINGWLYDSATGTNCQMRTVGDVPGGPYYCTNGAAADPSRDVRCEAPFSP